KVGGVLDVIAVGGEGAVRGVAGHGVGREVEDVRRRAGGEALGELLVEIGGGDDLDSRPRALRPLRGGVLDSLGLGVAGGTDEQGKPLAVAASGIAAAGGGASVVEAAAAAGGEAEAEGGNGREAEDTAAGESTSGRHAVLLVRYGVVDGRV